MTYTTADYGNKKDFAAALDGETHFSFLRVDGRTLRGDWCTDRTARGEKTVLDLYMKAAALLAEKDFGKFRSASGRFIADGKEKTESDRKNGKTSYYAPWQTVEGTEYFIFRTLGNAAKYEQLWAWARAMGAELALGEAEEAEQAGAEAAPAAGEKPGEELEDEEDAPAWYQAPVVPRAFSVVRKDGKYSLFDNDAGSFVTLPGPEGAGEEILEMTELEPLRDPDEETWEWDEDSGEERKVRIEGALLGYRYRRAPEGPWGFISRCFSQILPPRFSELRRYEALSKRDRWNDSYNGIVLAVAEPEATQYGNGEDLLSLWFLTERPLLREGGEEEETDLILLSVRETAERWYEEHTASYEPILEGDRANYNFESQWSDWAKADETPGEEPLFSLSFSMRSILYAPDRTGGECYFVNSSSQWEGDKLRTDFQLRTLFTRDHCLLEGGGQGRKQPFSSWDESIFPYFGRGVWYEDLRWLRDGHYAAYRDGYWALVSDGKLLTPYAFTGIEPLLPDVENQETTAWWKDHPLFLVERFGERGVAAIELRKPEPDTFSLFEERVLCYRIPCKYEEIELATSIDLLDDDATWEYRFVVRRMGFTGEIGTDGKWIKQLRREKG